MRATLEQHPHQRGYIGHEVLGIDSRPWPDAPADLENLGEEHQIMKPELVTGMTPRPSAQSVLASH